MKKGCFFTVISILTITIGVGFYLFKNHIVSMDSIIKPFVVKQIAKDIDKKFAKLKASPLKDSLQFNIKKLLSEIDNDKTFNFDSTQDLQDMIERIQFSIHDERLDSFEATKLTDQIKKHLNSIYERQKKNGN